MIRIAGHPQLIKIFDKHEDAKRWQLEAELKIRREEAGIAKVKFPLFRDVGLRYLNEVSVHKKCFRVERVIINSLPQEVWAEYPLNRISPNIIGKYRDRQRKTVKENTINRRLDVVSTIITTCKKEWGLPANNPVLSIRRPKNPPPRDRRFTDAELNLLLRGNRTSDLLRTVIAIALETGMRPSEILRIHSVHISGSTLKIPVAKTKPRTIPLAKKGLSLINSYPLPFNISIDRLGKQFRKLCKHYDIKDAHFADLRHQSLTNFMKDKNLNVPDTMLIAGHSDPRMLLRIYNNLRAEDVQKKLNN